MKALDTNILVRFLADDDAEQAALARSEVVAAERRGDRLFVSGIVLCELVWTLRSPPYGLRRRALANIIESLLGVVVFELENRDLVRQAVSAFRKGKGDFADHLLGLIAAAAGCNETLTLDRHLGDVAGFRLLGK